ncbi:MAG TPA: DUF1996 domain-containing protein [Acidimicrobiales bacterium]
MIRSLATAVAALCLVAGCGGAPSSGPSGPGAEEAGAAEPSAASEDAVPRSPTGAGPQGRVPQFVTECGFSHAASDDPIVHPGHTGASHLHTFFGNTTTASGSTADSLSEGATTCDQQLDRAAYWAPALMDHGTMVTPTKAVAYYRPGVGVDPATVEPYPFGLMMLGGDPHAEEPQSLDVMAWSCGTGSVRAESPPDCPEGRPLRLAVSFPDCWDGERVDSPDHVAHMARSRDGACPDSHPVPVPQLLLAISYPVTGGGHELSMSSGSVLTAHADFFNAWDPDKLRTEVETCLDRGVICDVASTRS